MLFTASWFTVFSTILLILIIIWFIWNSINIPKNFPPGPWKLPVLGHIPFMGTKPHVTLAALTKKYGDVFTIYLGPMPTIVLASYNVMKEALVKQGDIFAGRAEIMLRDRYHKAPGLVLCSGERWSEFRKFSLSTLRDFGMGQSILEPRIQDEIHNFIKMIEKTNGSPTDIRFLMRQSITNVICSIITGKRFDYEDPTLIKLIELSEQTVSRSGFGRISTILPNKIRRLKFLKYFGVMKDAEPTFEMLEILDDIVEKHDKKYEPGSKDNFVDAWLTEAKNHKIKNQFIDKHQLPTVLNDLFIAGSDTTTTTLSWALLYLTKHQHVQRAVQKEIDDVIGRERTPTMSDQKNMPFTEATLMEVSRIATIVPLSILHSTTADTTLKGFFIPKDTFVLPNLWAVHHDPNIFPEPHEFKPQRFLTDDQQIKKMDELIPFSMGKRQCLGESLARMELFLYFTSMLQQFSIQKMEGTELDFDHHYAIVSVPRPHKFRAIKR